MRVRPFPPQRDEAVAAGWLEAEFEDVVFEDVADEGAGLDTEPGTESGTQPVARDADDGRSGGRGAFGDRFAAGTGQFHVPRSRLTSPRGTSEDPISSIMTTKVVCARPEMDASLLRTRLLERGVSGAPVVDDWGRVVGVVSKTDLLEHEVTSERGRKTVGDIMMPMAFTLPVDASIGQAAALMAYEGVHRVVVVDAKGCVAGIVSTLDIARWLGWCTRYTGEDITP
jgi:CBS-domain-containing membrane protein